MAYQVIQGKSNREFDTIDAVEYYLFNVKRIGMSEMIRCLNKSLAGGVGKVKVDKNNLYIRKVQ